MERVVHLHVENNYDMEVQTRTKLVDFNSLGHCHLLKILAISPFLAI